MELMAFSYALVGRVGVKVSCKFRGGLAGRRGPDCIDQELGYVTRA